MPKVKEWKEAELMLHFRLTKIAGVQTPTMQEWLTTDEPVFDAFETALFENTYQDGFENIAFWAEEDLKMYFISNVLRLGGLMNKDNRGYVGLFEKRLSATVGQTKLTVRSDFMVAKGFKNIIEIPYFHFQEYKPQLNPTGEPMAQLLEAFLIGQAENSKEMPLYGCEVIGKIWTFVVMEGSTYCTSTSYDATKREDLLKIIAVLRKFKEILETRLLLA
ncbi:MAG: hypothetical protein ACKVTZ_23435 [Bacteroidia bacterium]